MPSKEAQRIAEKLRADVSTSQLISFKRIEREEGWSGLREKVVEGIDEVIEEDVDEQTIDKVTDMAQEALQI